MVLAVVSALVLVLAFPPTGAGYLVVPAVAGFLTAIRLAPRPAHAWLAGGGFGLVFFTFLFPWLAELGVIALIPLVLCQAAYPTVFARLLYRGRRLPAAEWALVAAAGWGVMEYLRERFPVGGFPWGMAGYPMGEYAAARGAAQWIGTSGWSMVVAFAAATLAVLVVDRRPSRWMATSIVVVGLLSAAGGLFPATADGPQIAAVIVQGSSPCPGRRCSGERAATFANQLELTSRITEGAADLVVWPEGSTGFDVDPILDPAVARAIGTQAARIGSVLLAGGDRPISDTEWINANVVWDAAGTIVGEYRKRHPVPFGEYVPARPLFDWIPDLGRVPRDMVRGDGPVLFEVAGMPFGSVISFESSFARYSRDTVRDGARLLVVATSQASYPYSSASDQLIGMTRMRSAELGVDVVHASVTGRSTIITGGGVVGPTTELAEVASIAGTVRFRNAGPTLYTILGDWLQLIAIAWFVMRAVDAIGRRRQNDS